MDAEAENRRWRLAAAWAAVLSVVLGSCAWYARGELIDDAFISFRYAANLVQGHGLVFNPGDRVEGYTNFLWVILMASSLAAGAPPEWASRIFGTIFAVATVVVVARTGRRGARPTWVSWIAPSLLAINPAFGLWATHGLETPLFTLLVTLGITRDLADDSSSRITPWPALAFVLATLTRPEGALVFAASFSWRLVRNPRLWRSRDGVVALTTYAGLVGAYWIGRTLYFGDLLPNTFYAKTGFSSPLLRRGLRYVSAFFTGWSVLPLLGAIPALLSIRRRPDRAYLVWMIAAYLGVVTIEGGDAFPAHRFLVPILPALYLLVQEGFADLRDGVARSGAARRLVAAAAAAGVAVHGWALLPPAERERRQSDRFTEKVRLVGLALRERMPPGTTIALNPAGAIPYYSGLRAYDMLGLTDRHIARSSAQMGAGRAGHEKGDGRYILERKPDLILLGNVHVTQDLPRPGSELRVRQVLRSEREVVRDPRFAAEYTWAAISIDGRRSLVFARRRDFQWPDPGGGG